MRWLITGRVWRALPVTLLLGASALSAPAAGAAVAAARPAAPVIFRAVKGCGEPLSLATPAISGEALSGRALGLPDGPGSVLAQAAKRHVRWLTTLKCQAHHAQQKAVGKSRAGNSFWNWAGFVDATPSPNYVQANWQVPSLGGRDGRNDTSSIWPGIGTATTKGTVLIQDGTEQDLSAAGKASYHLWFEVFPTEYQQLIKNMTVQPGNRIAVSASFNASAARGAEFVICNMTRRVCAAPVQKSKRPNDHAEWIVERTSLCSLSTHRATYPPLAPIGPVMIKGGRYDINGAGKPVFAISHATGKNRKRYKMSVGGTLIATSGGLSSHGSAFLVVQNSAGNFNHGKC